MAPYQLTSEADDDLTHTLRYGVIQFGLVKAEIYYDGLVSKLEEIAQSPLLYPAVDHIRQGYRRAVYHGHSIFYKIESDHVLIVRIIGRQDMKTNAE